MSGSKVNDLANKMSDLITCPDFMSGTCPGMSGSKVNDFANKMSDLITCPDFISGACPDFMSGSEVSK
jgi:hypothetical protein